MDYNDFTRIDNSPSAIREYLADSGLAARKRWGQNFLVDIAARQALLDALAPGQGQRIWEVGPGLGAMTAGLLGAGASVTAFEIDHGMVRHLKRRFYRHVEDPAEGGLGSEFDVGNEPAEPAEPAGRDRAAAGDTHGIGGGELGGEGAVGELGGGRPGSGGRPGTSGDRHDPGRDPEATDRHDPGREPGVTDRHDPGRDPEATDRHDPGREPGVTDRPVLHLVSGDAVKTLPKVVREYGRPDAILGNLPYNAAAPILWALLTTAEPIPRIVCTVQREVAERMVAAPGSRNFGPFAVLCSLEYHAQIIRKLSGGCFYPRPHVESSAVLLTATGAELPVGREKILRLTDAVFTQPRKTISNNLKALAGTRESVAKRLAAAQVSGHVRPSALSLEDIIHVSQQFEDLLTD